MRTANWNRKASSKEGVEKVKYSLDLHSLQIVKATRSDLSKVIANMIFSEKIGNNVTRKLARIIREEEEIVYYDEDRNLVLDLDYEDKNNMRISIDNFLDVLGAVGLRSLPKEYRDEIYKFLETPQVGYKNLPWLKKQIYNIGITSYLPFRRGRRYVTFKKEVSDRVTYSISLSASDLDKDMEIVSEMRKNSILCFYYPKRVSISFSPADLPICFDIIGRNLFPFSDQQKDYIVSFLGIDLPRKEFRVERAIIRNSIEINSVIHHLVATSLDILDKIDNKESNILSVKIISTIILNNKSEDIGITNSDRDGYLSLIKLYQSHMEDIDFQEGFQFSVVEKISQRDLLAKAASLKAATVTIAEKYY